MAVLDYTTYPDIRAALGVTDDELEDVTLGLSLYSSNLNLEIAGIDKNLKALYVTIAALTTRTADEEQLYETTRLFAVYAVAKQCCASLPMFGPKEVSDSKAAVVRFSDSPYKATSKEVYKQYETNKQRLLDIYRVVASASGARVTRRVVGVSKATFDPITG